MIREVNIIDLHQRRIYWGQLTLGDGKILKIKTLGDFRPGEPFALPGFVDAHIHIESSMLVPSEFARLAVVHGTVATVSDPHEIANVLGMAGVQFMIDNGKTVPFKFYFGAPSCVPATAFETAGAVLGVEEVRSLLHLPEIKYLSEVMNYPGVLMEDPVVMEKIEVARQLGKPLDGHAPGLRGEQLQKYIRAGISTDHECFTYEEGLEKIRSGMKVIIREGSAAKNFEALIPLLPQFPHQVMFCSDDKHPDDLVVGHINQLVIRALSQGCELFDVLRAACLNPVRHYNLEVGLLQEGDPADYILVKDLAHFEVLETWIEGRLVAQNGLSRIESVDVAEINHFHRSLVQPADFELPAKTGQVRVIHALNGEIVTKTMTATIPVVDGNAQTNLDNDLLKIAVINRYADAPPALAFIHGFGLREGALASCVGHDSHNVIVVGVDDVSMCRAANLVIQNKGGIAAVNTQSELVLPLPVAGIMTTQDGQQVSKDYAAIDRFAKEGLGTVLSAPFMTLSFMALLVIPELKLSDKGLFDGSRFAFTDVFLT